MTTKGSYSDELSSIINQVTNREDLEDPSLAVMLSETLVEGFSLRDTVEGIFIPREIYRVSEDNVFHLGSRHTVEGWEVVSTGSVAAPTIRVVGGKADLSYLSRNSLFIEMLSYTSVIPSRPVWTPVTYNDTSVRFSGPYTLEYTIVNGLIRPIPFPVASLGVPPYVYSISPSDILRINSDNLSDVPKPTIENTQALPIDTYVGTLTVTDVVGDTDSLPITIASVLEGNIILAEEQLTITSKDTYNVAASSDERVMSYELVLSATNAHRWNFLKVSIVFDDGTVSLVDTFTDLRSSEHSDDYPDRFFRYTHSGITIPANKSFGFRLEFSGSKQDHKRIWIDRIWVTMANPIDEPNSRSRVGLAYVS